MSVGVQKAYSVTAASNASADSNINFAEGQTPASLNNSDRAQMAAIKGFANQILGAKTTGGAADAQTFTSDSVAAIDTAYAAGMGFVFKAGYTNTGACTLNVDGVGATAIRKGGAATALAANDIVAGGIYFVVYNGTYWILLNPETGQPAAGFQALDATLTALAALSWSSGNAVVQFTAADTVSLTLAPSVTSVTASNGAATATPAGRFTNTTDAANNTALIVESDRATPTAYDAAWIDFYVSNGSGTQKQGGRYGLALSDITAGSEDGVFYWRVAVNGTVTDKMYMTSAGLAPYANDDLALGFAASGWSDGFFASGAVLGFGNGNFTLTHSDGALTASGAIVAATMSGRVLDSTETGGTLTSASRNRRVVCASAPTLPASGMTDGDFILIDPGGTARAIARPAAHTMYVRDTNSATGTSYAHNVALAIYHGSSKWTLHGVTG